MRPHDGYYFEDYRLGQRFVHATPRTITQGDVALYQALTGSRLPLHCSEPFAQALGYPAMPVDDLLVFHIAFGKTVPDISYNAVANLGYAECRFLQPVFIGDTLRAESEVIGLKANSSGKTGVVYVRSTCLNQRGEVVLTWIRWVMVNKRIADDKSREDHVPKFAPWVQRKDLLVPTFLRPAAIDTRATGGERFWEDYRTGAAPATVIIASAAGLTIDESDHTLATKLYQNTARVHFDQHHMKDSRFGQRLVYGGHIISICRTLCYDGLENALGIVAINSGTHHAPTFAGDTIYALSVVIDTWELSRSLGALRIRMSGFKNVAPTDKTAEADPQSHVLSLDYTVLMPRRP